MVLDRAHFDVDGSAILMRNADETLMRNADETQLNLETNDCNASYDLRVGELYRDHRDSHARTLGERDSFKLMPGNAVIIQTEEEVEFPSTLFGHILPKVGLLQSGIANTPSKVDPGYSGRLLITAFNHGKQPVTLRRRQKFCAMVLLRVDDGIRPYKGASKQLSGDERKKPWQRFRDMLEANVGIVSTLLIITTLFNTTLVAISLWR